MTLDAHGNEVIHGLNHDFFYKYFGLRGREYRERGSDLLDRITKIDGFLRCRPKLSTRHQESIIPLLQLTLYHLALHPRINNRMPGNFHESQMLAYANPWGKRNLLCGDMIQWINMDSIMHLCNFFRFILKAPNGEGVLAHIYRAFPASQLPRAWIGKLGNGTQRLGKHWKGFYSE